MHARDKDDLPWFLVGLGILAGFAMLLLGFSFLVRARRARFFRLFLCRDGLIAAEGREMQVFRWVDVEHVLESIKQEYFPLKMGLKYLLPLGKSHAYLIRRRDGTELGLDREVVPNLEKLERLLREVTQQRAIEWRIQESHF